MKNKKAKKGFTLVELLVVITILAVLATVSVIGYRSFTKKAQVSNDTSLVAQLNIALKANEATDGKPQNPTEALEVVGQNGFDVEKLTPTTSKYNIVWNQEANEFALLNEKDETVFGNATKDYKTWKFLDAYVEGTEYSVYLKGTSVTGELKNVKAGLDVGKNTGITKISYYNTDAKDVIIRTNSYDTDLTVDGANDTIKHYDLLGNLVIENVKSESYHEFGKVKNASIKNGRFVAEEGSELSSEVTVVEGGAATVETSKSAIWDKTDYHWSEDYKTCTASRKDKNGVKPDEIEEVVAEEKIIKEATTTEEGSKTYTATFKNPAFETQIEEVTIDRLLTEEEKNLNALNTELSNFETKNNRKPYTMHEALLALGDKRETAMSNADKFLWDSNENRFYTLEEVKTKVEASKSTSTSRNNYEFWKITKFTTNIDYSIYLADGYAGNKAVKSLRTGLDVGNNTSLESITFLANTPNSRNGKFIIRTNGNESLTINNAKEITHYGSVKSVNITGSKYDSGFEYIEKGKVTNYIKVSRSNVTVNLTLVQEQAAKAVVVSESSTIVKGNNKTPVCFTTSSRPSGISGVSNGNDIGKVCASGLAYFENGFGTQAHPFVVNSATDWGNVDTCESNSTLYFKLGSNFTIETNVTTLARKANIVLDLNGHMVTLKNDSVIQVGAKGLTIKDSAGNGGFMKSDVNGTRGFFASFADKATLNIEGGTFNGNYLIGQSANTETSITVTVKGGTYKLDGFIYNGLSKATLSIQGGTFNIDPTGTEFLDDSAYNVTYVNNNWYVTKK